MAVDWKTARLGDLVDSSLGKMLDAQKNKGTPRQYLGNSNVRWGSFDLQNLSLMRFENDEEERYGIRDGDLIVCEGGEPGRCAIWREQVPGMKIQKALHRVRPKDGLNNYYLFYWFMLGGRTGRLEPFFTGTTIKHLTGKALNELEVPIPPIEEQRAIAHILGTLDDKIELNRRRNQTLEAMARALFKDWFVDFGPVRARMEGREPYLPAELWQLFPELLDDEGKPEGWDVSTLGEICTTYGGFIQTGPFGSSLHASDYLAQGVPVVMPQDISVRRIEIGKIARVSEENADRLSRHRLQAGDIVFSRRGDVSRHALVTDLESGWLCGTGCLLVRPGNSAGASTYVSRAVAHDEAAAWLLRHAVGATMPNLNTRILSALPMLAPPDRLLAAFEAKIGPIELQISTNNSEVVSLAALRDTLLSKLISGELRIADAEKFIKRAGL